MKRVRQAGCVGFVSFWAEMKFAAGQAEEKKAQMSAEERVREWIGVFASFYEVATTCTSPEEISFRIDVLGLAVPDDDIICRYSARCRNMIENDVIRPYADDAHRSVTVMSGLLPAHVFGSKPIPRWQSMKALFSYLDGHCPYLANLMGARVRDSIARFKTHLTKRQLLNTARAAFACDEAEKTFGKYAW